MQSAYQTSADLRMLLLMECKALNRSPEDVYGKASVWGWQGHRHGRRRHQK